jgi:hypothetical protein
MGPPGGDFGALFGSGVGNGGGNAIESGWSWTAPGAQQLPTKTTSNGWNWGAKPAEPAAEWEQLLEIPRSGEELVEESREAFEELLQDAADLEALEAPDMAILTEFLASSADEPEAKNVSRLIQWLSGRCVSDPAWQSITVLICDKIKLASIDNEELLEVIRTLPSALDWEQDESARQRLHGIYAAFADILEDRAVFQTMFEEICKTTEDAQACSRLIAMLVKTTGNEDLDVISQNISLTLLAIHNCGAEDLTRTQLLSQLQMALCHIPSAAIADVLRLATRAILENGQRWWRYKGLEAQTWLDCIAPASCPVDHMSIVYAEVARRIPLRHIVDRFAPRHIDPSDIARFLLRTWLPNSRFDNALRTRYESRNAAYSPRGIEVTQHGLHIPSVTDLAGVEAEFEKLYYKSSNRNAWPNLLKAFKQKGFSYHPVVGLVLDICKVRHDPETIYCIFSKMLKDVELAIPTGIYVSIIEHFMAKGENHLAYKIFCESPSIAITDVPDLPLALLKDRRVKFEIFELLNRQPSPVPLEWRDTQKLSVTPGHIEIVHMLAHSCAHMASLRPSQAYRNVWALYRWLQDRGAPIQPIVSRALVTAGIVRYIKDYKWIPDERLEYILSIVEKVEGVEIRERVERLAVDMRASVHDKVIAKRRAKEESAWMKRSEWLAREAKFRLKTWTKLKPMPTGDGRSWVVPQTKSPGVIIPVNDFAKQDNVLSTPAPTTKRPECEESKIRYILSDAATDEADALTSEEMKSTNSGPKPSKSARMESWDFPRSDAMSSTPVSPVEQPGCEERKVESTHLDVVAVHTDALASEETFKSQDVLAVPAVEPIPSPPMEAALGSENPIDDEKSVDQMYFESAEEKMDE